MTSEPSTACASTRSTAHPHARPVSAEQAERADLDRRRFLAATGGLAALAVAAQLPVGRAYAAPRPNEGGPVFRLGVASGDPTPDGVVLWTRLSPHPYQPGGGMPPRRATVEWELANDAGFRSIVRRGRAWALPGLGHSVHLELRGLEPGREWFYRFGYRDETSRVGRTRTAPAAGSSPASMRLGFASCQSWPDGYYPSYAHLAEEDIDLVVHLGDYVYEDGIPADGGYRDIPVPGTLLQPPLARLERWRMQYALYRSDVQLQLAHARHPWTVTWDDHEVLNDYASDTSQYAEDISARRAAAYQAWYEHMPVRRPAMPGPNGPRIYRRLHWGDLVQLDVVDGRQYRSVPPCGWGEADACPAAYDPRITMLGQRQERWLYDGFAASAAQWNVLASNVMLARLDHDGPDGQRLWHDAWDGFPAARNRLTEAWVRNGVRNPVVITGDWHSTFVNDIRRDFDRPDSPVVATEFVGTSISSNGDGIVYGPYYGPMIKFNPHIKFFDGDRRGYVLCDVGRDLIATQLRMVRTVSRPVAPEYTYASFAVQDGQPGALQLSGPTGGDYPERSLGRGRGKGAEVTV